MQIATKDSRRVLLAALASLAILFTTGLPAFAEAPSTTETLPSWNEGPAKQASSIS